MTLEMPSIQEVFYGPNEPTFIMNSDPLHQRTIPHAGNSPTFSRDLSAPGYHTQALAPTRVAPISHVVPASHAIPGAHHPPTLELRVPMCCEKCIEEVREALLEVPGVRSVICDQHNQKVLVVGNVDPERALRRVRMLKKKSMFWNLETQPLKYSTSTAPVVQTKYLVNGYHAPSYSSSAYSRFASPPRSLPPRPYNSPYVDSSYRSGYVESRYGHYDTYSRPGHRYF